jgi:hypothetical protein
MAGQNHKGDDSGDSVVFAVRKERSQGSPLPSSLAAILANFRNELLHPIEV